MEPAALLALLALLFLYLLPALIAGLRQHHNTVAITVLNVLVGWTALGWIVALVWAFTATDRAEAEH